jgi:hypothetical protein
MKRTLITLLATLSTTLSLSAIAGRDLQSLTLTARPNQAEQQKPDDQSQDEAMRQMMKSCAEMMKGADNQVR